ncbi:DUF858 domain protein [Aspergillus unguis]
MDANPAGTGPESAPDSLIDHAASLNYWNGLPPTSSTMLGIMGDYPWYTRIDLRGSKTFLNKVRRQIPGCVTHNNGKLKVGVDCGAGVGRITEGLLKDACEVVDAVEPVEKFADIIREMKAKEPEESAIGDIYVTGLESWVPTKKYDLIWIQFCSNYVTDAQIAKFFERCCTSLTETGVVVVKENMSTDPNGMDMYDEEDSSVTRTDEKFRTLFKDAGLTVIASELQLGFPKSFNLFPVRFYALRPMN